MRFAVSEHFSLRVCNFFKCSDSILNGVKSHSFYTLKIQFLSNAKRYFEKPIFGKEKPAYNEPEENSR